VSTTTSPPSELQNVRHIFSVRQLMCCGFREISGLSSFDGEDPEKTFKHVALLRIFTNAGGIVFTDASEGEEDMDGAFPSYASGLAEYIKEHNLGVVTKTTPIFNPNSGSYVRLYVWETDALNVQRHLALIAPELKTHFNSIFVDAD
jgi:hypothetical protein